jgi:tripartite-type tricarboxylate transporter receptor subunit TctC
MLHCHTSRRAFFAATLAAAALPAWAAYPDQPVRLLVGYPPGGATDVVARLLATHLSSRWGQAVVVENKPGASGMLAAEQVVRAKPDGHTLLLGYTPEVSINKLVFKQMRYDPIADLAPLALAATAPLVLVAGPKLPVRTLPELLARKGADAKLSYGSPGSGGQQHIAGELLARLGGLPLLHVPYKGTAPALNDLLGGQIDLFFATTPPLLQHIRAGKLRPLAVAGDRREALLPDVPTFAELGMGAMQLSNWFGVFAPNGLSPVIANRVTNDLADALKDPKVVKSLEDQGLTPSPLLGVAFKAFIEVDMRKYKAIIDQTGIVAE